MRHWLVRKFVGSASGVPFYLILIYAHDGDSDLIRVIIVNIQCLYMFNDDITRRLPLYVLDSTVIDVFLEEPYLPSRGATNPLID